MKTKLFYAFSGMMLIGLLSNILFAWLIYRDFSEYSNSLREDQLGWVRASIETGYINGEWNRQILLDALHWGLMLGFYINVYDRKDRAVLSSEDVLSHLHPEMKKRMTETIDIKNAEGKTITFDLYLPEMEHTHLSGHTGRKGPDHSDSLKIGKIEVRNLTPWGIVREKEQEFKEKLTFFLVGSVIFVVLASLFLAYLMSYLISRPFIKLRAVTERLKDGDMTVRCNIKGDDEVSSLCDSFNRLVDRLKREDELRKHLAYQLTHELRTPLTILRANMEALRDGIIKPPQLLSNIEPEIERLLNLVRDMEEIVRAESSLFTKVKKERIELLSFVQKICEPFHNKFRQKGLYLRIEGPQFYVNTDPEKITIIIRNLLQNSIRYTDTGGVTIKLTGNEKEFLIKVSDTGRGIEPSKVPFIFKRFYKDENSRGLGIGLSIVDGLVRLLNGTIEVKSELSKGTTFKLYLKDAE